MSRRILITGAWFDNKGAEAMIRTVQAGVLTHLPQAEGLLLRRGQSAPSAEVLRGLGLWRAPNNRPLPERVLWLLAHKSGLLRTLARRHCPASLDLQAVIDISGYAFGDPWQRPRGSGLQARLTGRLRDAGNIRLWDLFRQLQVPVFHLPQAWGPFENSESRSLATRVIQHATLAYARDRQSHDWLRTLPSFDEKKVRLASDIAFTFKGAGPEVGEALLRSLGLAVAGEPLVGIVPNMRVYERAEGSGLANAYVQRLLSLTRHFAERRQCRVLLMPHEIREGSSARADDRVLCRLIAEAAGTPDRVVAALGNYRAEELKALIGGVDLLVSSRFHSLVGAMSLRRPVVALAWSHKYHELMGSVGLGEYVADYDALPEQELIDLCDRAWEDRDGLRACLNAGVPAHEASAAAVLDEVVEAVKRVS